MDLQKIYSDSDFQNAVVPEGQILVFNGLEDGKVVTRYKDSSGKFGTIAGNGGGGSSVEVTLGQINADSNFQSLAFNGTEAAADGEPETVESYYGWNGVLPVPEKGIKVGEAAEYYKCASVDTVNKTWTGYKAVLKDGFYTFEDTVTVGLTYGSILPKVGEIYDRDILGMYSPFKDPSIVPVINDSDTLLLIFPMASGDIENIGNGRSKCTGDISYEGLTVEEGKIIRDGIGNIVLPAGYLPEGILSKTAEWTLDIWYSLDLDSITEPWVEIMETSNAQFYVECNKDGDITGGSGRIWQTSIHGSVPVSPRRFTLESWNNNGTMTFTGYVNGRAGNNTNWYVSDNSYVWHFPTANAGYFYGTYALISIRSKADHKGQSFDPGVSPYQ